MSPNANGEERFPVGRLLDEIEKTFGSYDAFKAQFSSSATDLFGSGCSITSVMLYQLLLIRTCISDWPGLYPVEL